MSDLSRRRFLEVLVASAAASTGALSACSGQNDSTPEAFGDAKAGNIADLQVGTVRAVAGAPVFIGHDEAGVYAMTSTCTHEGCDMSSDGTVTNRIICQCHGSEFDLNGGVVRGPASLPLTHFAVDIASDGTITVRGGTKVGPSTRTPPA
jgi:cytochrome b6-f complex iron-sulfur subunit